MTTTKPKRLGALAMLAVFAIGACTGSGSGSTATPSSAPAGSAPASTAPGGAAPSAPAVSGTITVSGSSTVEPISTGVAELLKESNADFNYTIEGPGTGDGFKRFCTGEIDISDASRKIKDEEAATCKAAGIDYIELQIAFDGITVMTSPDNTAIECLSFPDLYALVGPESQGFAKWSDAQALGTELGTKLTYPDASLDISGPGEESGTYDSFVEIVLDKLADPRGKIDPATKHTTTRADYTASPNDNTIIENVAGSPSSLGWVGFAFAEENTDKVKELGVSKEAGGDCILPSAQTIADGTYPISRSLYLYVNKAKAAANPAVVGYVDYYLAEGTISTVLETVPYVNLPADTLAATRTAWDAR
ncbi:MAG: phosphate transport system substrate-binding protein [Chloroflexota bacterium]|nr:phosphate transport system substrate-binding protein [Chloroflexota bacterium]